MATNVRRIYRKRERGMLVSLLLLFVAAAGVFGYLHFAGSGKAPPKDDTAVQSPTGESLATRKGVAPEVELPDGRYGLIAVIEGAEANRNLVNSLEIISRQNAALAQLRGERGKTATAGNDTTAIDAKAQEIQKVLEKNLVAMRDGYGYSPANRYHLVPVESEMVLMVDGEEKETVRRFTDFPSYDAFQRRRDAYTSNPSAPDDTTKAGLREGLIRDYSFDPEKTHLIRFLKSAFYVKLAPKTGGK